jgi:hypothetical protein
LTAKVKSARIINMRTRRGNRKRKVPGVGDAIRRELRELERLVRALNTPQSGEVVQPIVEAVAEADDAGGPPPPFIPPAAAAVYNEVTKDFSFRYRANQAILSPRWPGVALLQPVVSHPAARIIPLLNSYFENPERGRLRRCAQCGRWFVDGTRNKSARRCSRACTVAWSNAQRPRRRAR